MCQVPVAVYTQPFIYAYVGMHSLVLSELDSIIG